MGVGTLQGHEYTLSNLRFDQWLLPNDKHIRERIETTREVRMRQMPTIPVALELERRTNPFMFSNRSDVREAVIAKQRPELGMDEVSQASTAVDIFLALRTMKDLSLHTVK